MLLNYLINNGLTNAESAEIIQTGKVLTENTYIPQDILDNPGFKFIMSGITQKPIILQTIKQESTKLNIDYKLVLSALLGEQIRIANRGLRGTLKDMILYSTPKLLRSYDISLGIGGIKISTAKAIAQDAITYGYGDLFKNNPIKTNQLSQRLTQDDYRQAIYPTYLVKNILTRRTLSGYNITNNPGVVGTLYNMGNASKKNPNANPKIGGSLIEIGENKYTYGEISLYVYRFLQKIQL